MPGTKPELSAAAGDHVESGDLASEQRWVPEAHVEYVRAQTQPPAAGRRRRKQRERAHRAKMIGRGQRVETELIGPAHDPLEIGSVRRAMEVDAELDI